jgi:hypothetical protein
LAASEVIGWLGTLLLLGAYALTSTGRISARSATYHALNAAGAAAVAANVIAHRAWPASVLELCWALIALVSLARAARH